MSNNVSMNIDLSCGVCHSSPQSSPNRVSHREMSVYSDSDTESDTNTIKTNISNNIIDGIYKSMSHIVESLNTDHALLDNKAKCIYKEIEYITHAIMELKLENRWVVSTVESKLKNVQDTNELITLVNKLKTDVPSVNKLNNVQKQIIDTRTLLLCTIKNNIREIKKELEEIRNIKQYLRPQIKNIVVEEVKNCMANLPCIDKQFNDLAKEHRASLSQHIRKSTVLHSNMNATHSHANTSSESHEIAQIKKQHLEFVQETNNMFAELKKQINDLKMMTSK